MVYYVCPWWMGYVIDNPLRRLLHNPTKILGPYVRPGMTTMDVGCGMGIFSIAMARMVGPGGRVIAVDLQQRMLDVLRKRATKAGIADRIETHRCEPNRLGVEAAADFALAFAMVHEVPDASRLLREVYSCLRPGGKLLVAEPRGHVPRRVFEATVAAARNAGFQIVEEPRIRRCQAVLFAKPDVP
jgi:ubiquinone/menaquinone biosynthesis C-methylase UbiE